MSKTSQEALSSPIFNISPTTSRSTYRVGRHETTLFRMGWVFAGIVFLALTILGFVLVFSASAAEPDEDKQNTTTLVVPKLDSDGDGILDFYETNVYGTDPTKADSDGDGFHDDMELMWGHDPLNPTPNAKYLLSTFSPFLRTSDAYISRNLTVKGTLVADDQVKISDELKVLGPAEFSQNATFGGKLNLQGSLHNSKGVVSVKDSLKVSSRITAKNLTVKKKITTKNLRVTSNMTVEDMTLRRNSKNRLVLGGYKNTGYSDGSQPIIVAGTKRIAGELACTAVYPDMSPIGSCSYVNAAGTVNFPANIALAGDPVVIVQPLFEGAKIWDRLMTDYYGNNCDPNLTGQCAETGLQVYVESYIRNSSQKVIGFNYQVRKPSGTKSETGNVIIGDGPTTDLTPTFPINWVAYGFEK